MILLALQRIRGSTRAHSQTCVGLSSRDFPSLLAPFGQASVEPTCIQPFSTQGSDGLMGIDAVGTSAIGDDLGIWLEHGQDLLQFSNCDVQCVGDMPRGVFIGGSDVEQGDRTLRQTSNERSVIPDPPD